MNFRAMTLFAATAIAIATTSETFSQTCRVKTSSCKGATAYTEVYEYDYVDQKPEYPGGRSAMINFINNTREYPTEAYDTGIEGRVTCSFVVNTDGKISHIQILRGVETSLNNEAMRIVASMPSWSPGMMAGHAVPTRVVCCIPFRK